MEDATVALLKEVNSGCKSATNSMEQVLPYVSDNSLKTLIEKYNNKHIDIGDRCHVMLNELDKDEKDPHPMAKAFSWMSTEVKLMMNDDRKKIAGLMVDGCEMGIKSVSGYINQYDGASKDVVDLANELVKVEKDFMEDLLKYV